MCCFEKNWKQFQKKINSVFFKIVVYIVNFLAVLQHQNAVSARTAKLYV